MSLVAALALAASAAAPQAGDAHSSGTQTTTATASTKVIRSVSIRRGKVERPTGQQAQVSRTGDGRAIVEFY